MATCHASFRLSDVTDTTSAAVAGSRECRKAEVACSYACPPVSSPTMDGSVIVPDASWSKRVLKAAAGMAVPHYDKSLD